MTMMMRAIQRTSLYLPLLLRHLAASPLQIDVPAQRRSTTPVVSPFACG